VLTKAEGGAAESVMGVNIYYYRIYSPLLGEENTRHL
jgi:hypothetical protein